jgi:hypothetical protein
MDVTIRVIARYFVAGLVVRNGMVVDAAPILKKMGVMGMSEADVVALLTDKGFALEFMGDNQ